MAPEPIRIVLADDHPLIRAGLRTRLDAERDLVVVGEAADADAARHQCRNLQPDILILDLNMPGPKPVATMAMLREQCPGLQVLVLTAYDDPAYVYGLLAAGVAGYVLKDEAPDALVEAVRGVARGGAWFSRHVLDVLARAGAPVDLGLSERETALLRLLARGWDNARIANELNLAEQTVRNYLSRLYAKLGVQTRAEAIVWAHERGMTP
ncbi:MAG TPA: response regulator transcription factor [Thermomicrobiales bacterium]|nr:response regulator transcription factor [Thermomicrobiales bacterium]